MARAIFHKIEENVVYLGEGYWYTLFFAANILCRGSDVGPVPIPSGSIQGVKQSVRQPAQEESPLHVAFIREGCKGCVAHDRHQRWVGLKKARSELSSKGYLEELEFSYINHQIRFVISQMFLEDFPLNRDLYDSASTLQVDDVTEVLLERLRLTTTSWGGLLTTTFDMSFDDNRKLVVKDKPIED